MTLVSSLVVATAIWSGTTVLPPCQDLDADLSEIRARYAAGLLSDALTLSDEALACESVTVDQRIELYLARAAIHDRVGLHWNRRPVPESLEKLDRATALWDSASAHSHARIELGRASWWYRAEMAKRKFERSEMYARQALRRFTDLADFRGQADAVHRLGLIAFQRRELDLARAEFDRSLELEEQSGQPPRPALLADYERHVGFVLQVSGDVESAIPYFERSLQIRQDGGLDDAAMFAATTLGAALLRVERPADAEVPARYAMETADRLDSPEGWIRAGLVLGEAYEGLGNLEGARRTFERTRELALAIDRSSVVERATAALNSLGIN